MSEAGDARQRSFRPTSKPGFVDFMPRSPARKVVSYVVRARLSACCPRAVPRVVEGSKFAFHPERSGVLSREAAR